MNKYMRIGLLAISLLLIMGGASGKDSSSFGSGDISLELLDIEGETENKIKIDYGDPLKLRVTFSQSHSGYIDIRDRDNNNIVERFVFESGMFSETFTLPVESYRPVTNFTIIVNLENQKYVSDDKIIVAELSEPEILVELENYNSRIAKGDKVIFEGTITADEYKWALLGPYDQNSFQTLAETSYVDGTQTIDGTEALVSNSDHEIELGLSTQTLLGSCGGATGSYALQIWSPDYPQDVEEVDFTIEKPEVDLIVDRNEIAAGEELEIKGETNVAVSNSELDDTSIGVNKVTIEVYNSDSKDKVETYSMDIRENRTFQKEIEFPLSWEKDVQYRIEANITTGTGHYDKDTEYIYVTSPQVEFDMDSSTFRRDDVIKFKGSSSLDSGSLVYLKKSDLNFVKGIEDKSSETVDGTEYITAMVGSDGTWSTSGMHISEDASITSYKVTAVIFSPDETEELDDTSVKINIMKDELEIDLDKKKVVRGGSINVTGSTTTDRVYIFACEDDIFGAITEEPSSGIYNVRGEDKAIHTKKDGFNYKVKVREDADIGYCSLSFYGSSSDRIDTNRAPQEFFLISVVESMNSTETPQPAAENGSTPSPSPSPSPSPTSTAPVNDSDMNDVNNTSEKQNESAEGPTPQPTATSTPDTNEEEQSGQNSQDTEGSAKETPDLRKREDMTVPTLQKMVPGFEFVFAVIGILAAIYLRRR
ncbi:MAG: PGF-CTERM sorting domain-containing protein [Archaeoglobaceae archaeon]